MAIPKVAIIGRPNVGKSSLLNALAGQMISIVEPTPGITRDRVGALVEWQGRYVELVDTGGYGIVDEQSVAEHVENQITQAIMSADLVLFITDIRDGITPLDQQIAAMLRKTGLDVIGVANKADSAKMFPQAAEFIKLGFGEFLCVSAANNLNKNELMDLTASRLEDFEYEAPTEPVMKLAVVGKRNAGKSTIVNAIAGGPRVIVTEIPGTTRDAVDVRIQRDDKEILVIDTAGVRKKGSMSDVDFYSYVRAERSIKRADVVLFLIDATLPLSQVDKKLAHVITEQFRSCILVVNKWDLVEDKAEPEQFQEYLSETMPGLRNAPIAFTSAEKGDGIEDLLELSGEIFVQATYQIPTAKLNKAFELIKQERVGASRKSGRLPKIYYAAQVGVNPITILMFVNDPRLIEENYRRFIINRLREHLPIDEVPIRLFARARRPERE